MHTVESERSQRVQFDASARCTHRTWRMTWYERDIAHETKHRTHFYTHPWAENWRLFAKFGLHLSHTTFSGFKSFVYAGFLTLSRLFRGGIKTMNRLRIFNHYLCYLSVCHPNELKRVRAKKKQQQNNTLKWKKKHTANRYFLVAPVFYSFYSQIYTHIHTSKVKWGSLHCKCNEINKVNTTLSAVLHGWKEREF